MEKADETVGGGYVGEKGVVTDFFGEFVQDILEAELFFFLILNDVPQGVF